MCEKHDEAEVAKFSHRLDLVSDDLCIVCSLLAKPGVCMAAPEVMDALRLALEGLCARMSEMSAQMRAKDV